ncbi:MAG: heparin lyase I family protein [Bacteroidota bacterium]
MELYKFANHLLKISVLSLLFLFLGQLLAYSQAPEPDRIFSWDRGDSGHGFWGKAINCGINSNQPGGGRNTKGSKLTFGVTSQQRFPGARSVEFWTHSEFEEVCNQNFSAERSEIHANDSYRGLGVSEGQSVWFGWSDFYSHVDFSHWATLMQFRNNCGSGSPSTEIKLWPENKYGNSIKGLLVLATPQGKKTLSVRLKEGKWYDWILEIKYSKGGDGFVRIWCAEVGTSERLVYENPMYVYRGNTMKPEDNCPHIRWGLYRWESADKKPHQIPSENHLMVKYLGEVRMKVGNNLGKEGFQSVIPRPPGELEAPIPWEEEEQPTASCDLPSDWISGDIGTPNVEGQACLQNGKYLVEGAGADIWSAADQFHYLSQKVVGDVEMVARLTSLEEVHRLSKAGIMIRKSLSASSPHVFLALEAYGTQSFQYREEESGITYNKSHIYGGYSIPHWIKLVRKDHMLSGFSSSDGQNWNFMDQMYLPMGEEVYIGLASNSHDESRTTKARFDQVEIRSLESVEDTLTDCSLPIGWIAKDVGNPGKEGWACQEGESFRIAGAGFEIGNTSDQLQFVYRNIGSETEIIAQLTQISMVDPLSIAGIMIRNDLSSNSPCAFLGLDAVGNQSFIYREKKGDFTQIKSTIRMSSQAPKWLRMVRSGIEVKAYTSQDGVEWEYLGQVGVDLEAEVKIGLAISSHKNSTLAEATFDSVRVKEIITYGSTMRGR